MKIEEFFENYGIKRNPIQLNSPYENRMIEIEDDIEEELEDYPVSNTWTLIENTGDFKLVPGIGCKNAIGYFISVKAWNDKNLKIELE